MKRPTKAEREVLECMSGSASDYSDGAGFVLLGFRPVRTTRAHRAAFRRLARELRARAAKGKK